jgi:hypothetical protein
MYVHVLDPGFGREVPLGISNPDSVKIFLSCSRLLTKIYGPLQDLNPHFPRLIKNNIIRPYSVKDIMLKNHTLSSGMSHIGCIHVCSSPLVAESIRF